MKALALLLSPEAIADVAAILETSFEEWGADAAEHYEERLFATMERLRRAPGIGQPVDPRIARDVRRIPMGVHTVFCRQGTDTLTVIRVLHQRMDIQRHLK